MPEYSIVVDLPSESWNSFVEKFSAGNFEQCFEYGEISKRAFPKANVVRLACFRHNELVGVLQGTYSKYFGLGMTLGAMRGPIVNTENGNSTFAVKSLLKALEDYAKKNRIIEARIFVPEALKADIAFSSFRYSLVCRYNEYIVSLKGGSESLWGRISHNKRRNIKKALREGVEVFESREMNDLQTFYSLLKAAEKRGGFTSYPYSWFKAVWDVYDPKLSRVFLARWNKRAVSGVFTVMHGDTVFALAAGSLREGWKVRPNDILHWKVMEWAADKGYSQYHMGLVSDPPPTQASASWGVWRWKREWKGNLQKLKVFHKFFHQKYRLILKAKDFAQKTYQFILRLK